MSKLRHTLKIWLPILILVVVALFIASQFVEPPPPRRFVLATGDINGAYYAFGKEYKQRLAQYGITVELLVTAGSIENIGLLHAGEADVGFVQGGVSDTSQVSANLRALASIYYEPLWVFYRRDEDIQQLTQLAHKRIGVGEAGSGTQVVATRLLEMNGVTTENAELVQMRFEQAAANLESGRLDVGFFVASPTASIIHRLLQNSQLRLLSFQRHSAYVQTLSFLQAVTIPEGLIDLEKNIPPKDVVSLSTTATLVCRSDFHPRLVEYVLESITPIHAQSGLLEGKAEFPSMQYVDFPLAEAAKHYFELGPSFLSRHLPFWAVSLISRFKLLLLPALIVLFRMGKFAPSAYRWGVGKRVYKWYDVLHEVESSLEGEDCADHLEAGVAKLRALEDEVTKVSVPSSYRKEIYNLRMHIDLIVKSFESRLDEKNRGAP